MPNERVCPTTALPPTLLEPTAAEQPMCLMHVSWGEGGVECPIRRICDFVLCCLFQILMVLMAQMGL